ncbi:MAG: ABC transporter ATP-binding protein [Chloroflexota bacterium]
MPATSREAGSDGIAVDGIDLRVDEGEIVSIIGPNGAGKTTAFNLITGFIKPTSGRILFRGEDITRLSPDRVMARGIARTFQNIRVFANMTVMENVMVGAHCRMHSGWLHALLRPPSTVREEAEVREKALRMLGILGPQMVRSANAAVQTQTYANRRRTEIARALASDPQLLLLDEPTAGMNPLETVDSIDVIRRLRDRGITIVLIEHKLKVVMTISDRVLVLDYGTKIAEGTPDEVSRNERVIEAYLGRKAAASVHDTSLG